jgi:hypothetical protein
MGHLEPAKQSQFLPNTSGSRNKTMGVPAPKAESGCLFLARAANQQSQTVPIAVDYLPKLPS